MTSEVYPETDLPQRYLYNNMGQLSELKRRIYNGMGFSPEQTAASATYGVAGEILSMTYFGVTETRQYNERRSFKR